MFVAYPRANKWDTGISINGFLAGLVAITCPCYWVSPFGAICIGAIAGVVVILGIDLLEYLRIDDPIGAVPVHGFAGIFGTLSIGLWATGGYGIPGPDGADTTTTMRADGNVPAAFRCTDGNTSDARTHIETWNTLRAVAGRADFLYVADSKLCSRENMDYIDRAGGRFVTVLPRTRLEDQEFRDWIQTNTPAWELVWDRPNPRHSEGPRDCWFVFKAPLPSAEVWPVVWVWSTLLTLHQAAKRRRRIAAAIEKLEHLRKRL